MENINQVVLDFNKRAFYKIIHKTEKYFIIKDLQEVNDFFTVKKSEWYEKIYNYYVEEVLKDKDIMKELNESDIKKILNTIIVLYKELYN